MDNIPIEIWNSSPQPAKSVGIEFDSEMTVVKIDNKSATEFPVSGNGSKKIGIMMFVDNATYTGNNKLRLTFESKVKSPTILRITWIDKNMKPHKMSESECKRINQQFKIPPF